MVNIVPFLKSEMYEFFLFFLIKKNTNIRLFSYGIQLFVSHLYFIYKNSWNITGPRRRVRSLLQKQ